MLKHYRIKDYYQEKKMIQKRVWFLFFVVIVLFFGLFSRLYILQVIDYQSLSTQANDNRIHLLPLPPTRGLIFDSSGDLIATNRPTQTLTINRSQVENLRALVDKISTLIPISDDEKENFFKRVKRFKPFEPVPLKFDLTPKEVAKISVNLYQLSNVDISAELERYYPYGDLFAHAVGYIGRINDVEAAKIDADKYRGLHSIGKSGLEKSYQDALMGTVGYEEVESDASGRVVRVLKTDEPKPGKDLHLYLDMNLQQAAVKAMGANKGAVVALDPKTGGILALASNPSFNPNLFVTGISFKDYHQLRDDIKRPLYNRATLGEYPPASTIKPFMALALLKYNIVTPEDKIYDPGWYQIPGNSHRFRNWKRTGHGWVDLEKALVVSNDTYFYSHALDLGITHLHDTAVQFGFGHKTGIDIDEERPGLVPSIAWKKRVYNKPWYLGETVIAMIGQGYMLATPLQLAEGAALIANRGIHVEPKLVKDYDNLKQNKPWGEDINIGNAKNWDIIIHAMEEVIRSPYGTAHRKFGNPPYSIAGKTGTAQVVGIPQGEKYSKENLQEFEKDHSLFLGFAPVDNPKIAVAVVMENNDSAVTVAKKVFDAYLIPDKKQM